ncbi:MAG TPA: glutamate-cysteine ligase family protein, partial [Catenuloplanes sp.]
MYRAAGASAGSDPRHPDALIVAVAEEFLLLDPRTGQNAPVAGRLCGELADPLRTRSRPGRRHSMVEIVTPACDNLLDLGRHLIAHRRGAAEAAAAAGARLVAVGATPIDDPQWPDPPRSADRALADCYGPIASDPAVCGCHVHVDVPDRELAVQVCNHLRGWLPVVQAITVNSPLHSGADSGH